MTPSQSWASFQPSWPEHLFLTLYGSNCVCCVRVQTPGLDSEAGCFVELVVVCGPGRAGQAWAVEGSSGPWPCSSFRNDSGHGVWRVAHRHQQPTAPDILQLQNEFSKIGCHHLKELPLLLSPHVRLQEPLKWNETLSVCALPKEELACTQAHTSQ